MQINYIKTPHDLQEALKHLYHPSGFVSEFLVIKDLVNTTLDSCNRNVEKYLNKIKRQQDNLLTKKIAIPKKVIFAFVLNNLSEEYNATIDIITASFGKNSSINLEDLFSKILESTRLMRAREASAVKLALATSTTRKRKARFVAYKVTK